MAFLKHIVVAGLYHYWKKILFNVAWVDTPGYWYCSFELISYQFSLFFVRSLTFDNEMLPWPEHFFFCTSSWLSHCDPWQRFDVIEVTDKSSGGKRTFSSPTIVLLPLVQNKKPSMSSLKCSTVHLSIKITCNWKLASKRAPPFQR